MSDNLKILCFYSNIIVNIDNRITYNGGSHEFLTATSDMSLNKLHNISHMGKCEGNWLVIHASYPDL